MARFFVSVPVVVALSALCASCIARQPARGPLPSGGAFTAPAPDAWPARTEPSRYDSDQRDALTLLVSPVNGPPNERDFVCDAGLGRLWRVRVDELSDAGALARLRREGGFVEWLVFQTYLGASEDANPGDTVTISTTTHIPKDSTVRLVEVSETSFALYMPKETPKGLVLQ